MRFEVRTLALVQALCFFGCYRVHMRAEGDAAPDVAVDAIPLSDALPDAPLEKDALPLYCARDRECPSSLCVHDFEAPPEDLAEVRLRCGPRVGPLDPLSECNSPIDCSHGLCTLFGGCVRPCADASDCGEEERCARVPIPRGPSSLQFTQACIPWVVLPEGVRLSRREDVRLAPRSTLHTFEIPPSSALAQLFLHVAGDDDPFWSVLTIDTSDGRRLFDISLLGMSPQPLVALPSLGGVLPILISNGDRDFPEGTGFVARIYLSRTFEFTRLGIERNRGGRTLDLDFVSIGVSPPINRMPPPDLAPALSVLDALLRRFGLELGRIRHFNLPGSLAETHAIIEEPSTSERMEVGDILALSAGNPRPSLPVFLIRSAADFFGTAGSLPGPMGSHGTRASGIIIALEDIQNWPGPGSWTHVFASVLVHEFAHFAGLFHTSEADGSVFEPLSDTPECKPEHDANMDGVLAPEECVGRGAENLMFWLGNFEDPQLSPRQRQILERAMVLR
ncbi:MAG: hypothetical protein NZM37_05325 [Sandaracinaceae bacterium]|nr:hypothetical protein [Sandaracinaceae bacterium]MDW8246468.1 hypothetical protein [Sandaracinaceae bacterium]